MHNMYANFAKNLEAHKHYAQEFVNERANEQTGAIIKTLTFFHFTLQNTRLFKEKAYFFIKYLSHNHLE